MYALEGTEVCLDYFNYLTLQFPLLIHPVYNIIRLCNSYNNKGGGGSFWIVGCTKYSTVLENDLFCIYLLQLRWKYFSVSFMILKTGLHYFWCQSAAVYRDEEHYISIAQTYFDWVDQIIIRYFTMWEKIKHPTKVLTVRLDTRQGSLSVKSAEFIMSKHKLQVQIFL